MKFMYNVCAFLGGTSVNLNAYTSKGLVIGRPQPMDNRSIDDLERDGWIGVYDPSVSMDMNQIIPLNGAVVAEMDLVPFESMDLKEIVKSVDAPESTLDDRIKELKNDLKNPAKYRARWAGTRYVYERITPK